MDQEFKESQSLAELIKEKILAKQKSLRNELIDEAVARINIDRENTNFKKVTAREIAVRIAHLKDADLHFLMKKCRNAPIYSRCFFGLLK